MLWDRAYGFSSLSEKTGKSNGLQMDSECWSGRRLNPRPLAQQTGALPATQTSAWPEVTPPRNSIVLYTASFCAVFLTSNQRRSDLNAKKHLRTWKEKNVEDE